MTEVRALLAHRRVLIVCRNKGTSELLRSFLLDAGAQDLGLANTAQAARDRIEKGELDLVVVDLEGTDDSGLSLVEGLRALPDPRRAGTPVLLLVDQPSSTLIARARAAQVAGIVRKPLVVGIFSEHLSRMFAPRAAKKPAGTAARPDKAGEWQV